MYYADKIKMNDKDADNLIEIAEIHIYSYDSDKPTKWITREALHDILKNNNDTGYKVDISPYPSIVHAVSSKGDHYVKSRSDSSGRDNLLNLPKV